MEVRSICHICHYSYKAGSLCQAQHLKTHTTIILLFKTEIFIKWVYLKAMKLRKSCMDNVLTLEPSYALWSALALEYFPGKHKKNKWKYRSNFEMDILIRNVQLKTIYNMNEYYSFILLVKKTNRYTGVIELCRSVRPEEQG